MILVNPDHPCPPPSFVGCSSVPGKSVVSHRGDDQAIVGGAASRHPSLGRACGDRPGLTLSAPSLPGAIPFSCRARIQVQHSRKREGGARPYPKVSTGVLPGMAQTVRALDCPLGDVTRLGAGGGALPVSMSIIGPRETHDYRNYNLLGSSTNTSQKKKGKKIPPQKGSEER